MNPIEAAVRPLKAEAVARAEQEARELVGKVTAALEAHGWDSTAYAPYPEFGYDAIAKAKYRLVGRLTVGLQASRKLGEHRICRMDSAKIEKFVADIKDEAGAQYEAFVGKIVAKIGDVTAATLEGNHVWSYSRLTVTKPDGSLEAWKTQTIVNYSKYGTPFYQWPTRKVK